MKRSVALRRQRQTAMDAMAGLLAAAVTEGGDPRELTAEENHAYEAHEANVTSLDAAITQAEALEARQASAADPVETITPVPNPNANGNRQARNAPGDPAALSFESLAEFVSTVVLNPNDQRLASLFDASIGQRDISAGQNMGTGARGGYMVPTEFLPEIMRVDPVEAVVRSNGARIFGAGDNPDAALEIPALDQARGEQGGIQTFWSGEGQKVSESDAELKQIKLEPQELTGIAYLTNKLIRNWSASGTFVSDLFNEARARAEDQAFVRGNGVGKPQGFLTSTALLTVARATANQVKFADIAAMRAKLLGSKGVWLINQSAMAQIIGLKDDAGALVYVPSARDGDGGILLGLPVRWTPRASMLGSKGDVILVDLSHYLIRDGAAPAISVSDHFRFDTNETAIKIVSSVDGRPWLDKPHVDESGNTLSPFVALGVPE